jgi:uncharacterized membrane protein YfcA
MGWFDLLVTIVIFLISFFSAISGGIGLLTRPFLILAGYPPEMAIGTYRVANLMPRMTGFSAILHRHGFKTDWKLALSLFIPAIIGGVLGAQLVTRLPADAIKKILGAFILMMGVILFFKREFGMIDRQEPATPAKNMIGFIDTVIIGILSAFIGNTGILFTYMLVFLYNKSYLTAAPIRKVINFISALSSSIFFIIRGAVSWKLMILILIAGIWGEFLGSRCKIRKGEEWIRVITLVLVFAAALTLFIV